MARKKPTCSVTANSAARVELDPTSLLNDCNAVPAPAALKALGTEWHISLRSLALVVPSAIFPDEYDVLLNPRHSDMRRVRMTSDEPFAFDARLR